MYDKENVLIGPGRIYYVDTSDVELGYYLGGVRFKLTKTKADLTKCDILGSYDSIKIGEYLVVSTVLMEVTLQNLYMVANSELDTGSFTGTQIDVGGKSTEEPFQLRLEGKMRNDPTSGTRTVTIWKCYVGDCGEWSLNSKRNIWTIPVKFNAVHDESRDLGERLFRIADDAGTPFVL